MAMTTDQKIQALKIMVVATLADYTVFLVVWTFGIIFFLWICDVSSPPWLMAAGFVTGLLGRDLGKYTKRKLTPNA